MRSAYRYQDEEATAAAGSVTETRATTFVAPTTATSFMRSCSETVVRRDPSTGDSAAHSAYMVGRALVNLAAYAAVGLDPREARRQALRNPHYQETLAWMGERVVAFLDEQGMIGAADRPLWRRSLLAPA